MVQLPSTTFAKWAIPYLLLFFRKKWTKNLWRELRNFIVSVLLKNPSNQTMFGEFAKNFFKANRFISVSFEGMLRPKRRPLKKLSPARSIAEVLLISAAEGPTLNLHRGTFCPEIFSA